ncbi:MAG: NAD-dependent epimerase/dehydratase family protein [Dehalococcoidia bacterium]|nr:NAD-dependent epimerase/dehydratase family protein [Dehalococcoidia bacterium]
MKTLVTGSTGCVGTGLVERLLAKGYEVRALARKTSDLSYLKTTKAEIVFGDVTQYETLVPAVQGIDIVFHCAAKVTPGWGPWSEFEAVTVEGTKNMLKASAEAGVKRFVQFSSVTVYGDAAQKKDGLVDENTPCEAKKTPASYYDYAKRLADEACWEYHKQGKIKVSMIRIGIAYGPRDRLTADRTYIQTLIPIVAWPGKANPRFAVVHTRDIAELAILAATSDKAIGQVYHAAGPEVVRMKDVTRAMMKAQGGPKVLITIPFTLGYVGAVLIEGFARLVRTKSTPFLNRNIMLQLTKEGALDGTKARTELGWVPQISLEEGCRQYVQWRRNRKKSP